MRKQFTAVLLAGAICLSLTGCLGKSSGGPLTQQGLTALEQEEYDRALADFEQAIRNGEDIVPADRGRGIAYVALARYQEAIACFDEALANTDQKMPETIRDIKLYLMSTLYRKGDYDRAIKEAQELSEEGLTGEICYFMGASLVAKGETEEGRSWFDQAISLLPRDYQMYLQIYEAFEVKNLTALGDSYLQTALKIQPETMEESYQVGQIFYYLEQYDEARRVLDGPCSDGYQPAIELMGEVYLAQEDYAHALSMFTRIMDERGESPTTDNGLAMCYMASGDYDQALSYIQRGLALEEETGKQFLRFNEIVAYERKLDFATALVKAEAYAALYPGDIKGKKELAFLSTRGK